MTHNRWLQLVKGFIIVFCLGGVYSWSVFRKPLESELNCGAVDSGLPFILFLFFFSVLMPLTGRYIQKYNPKVITIIGGVLLGLGWVASGFVHTIALISLTYGVIAGSGVGILYGIPVAIAAQWFPDRKGFAVGLTILGFGISPLITAPLARYFISNTGIFNTFIIFGLLFFCIVLLMAFTIRFPEQKLSNNSQIVTNSETASVQSENRSPSTRGGEVSIFKNSKFFGLWMCFFIGTFSGLKIIGMTSSFAQEIIQLTPEKASFFVAFFSIFNGIGRPLFGWVTDKSNPRFSALVTYVIMLVSSGLMLLSNSMGVFVLTFSLFWLTFGGWLAIAPSATATFFGEANFSKNYGYMFTAYGAGAIAGNLTSGLIRDLFGSYIYIFYPIIVLSIVGIILGIKFLSPPSPVETPQRDVSTLK